MQIILTEDEITEMLMRAWVDGWQSKHDKNDDGKRHYVRRALGELVGH